MKRSRLIEILEENVYFDSHGGEIYGREDSADLILDELDKETATTPQPATAGGKPGEGEATLEAARRRSEHIHALAREAGREMAGDQVGALVDAFGEVAVAGARIATEAYEANAYIIGRLGNAVPDLAHPQQGGEWALADIATERRRQVEAEGWTPEHDDIHSRGEMASAAACYALSHTQRWHLDARDNEKITNHIWPWDACWWKPGDRRRELVKAGALIVAEIERLDRATAPTSPSKSSGEEACPHCDGRRWVDDENWSSQSFEPVERTARDGLIPCGGCNFAGWDTPLFSSGAAA